MAQPATMTTGGIVYLLHYPRPLNRAGHYLGVAATEAAISTQHARHGAGWRLLDGTGAEIADVWECTDAREAEALYGRLKRQGGRRRLCSVCSPGNSRGGGTGRYERKPRAKAQKERSR